MACRRIDVIFEKYQVRATEMSLDAWSRRGLAHKFQDNLYYLWNELL